MKILYFIVCSIIGIITSIPLSYILNNYLKTREWDIKIDVFLWINGLVEDNNQQKLFLITALIIIGITFYIVYCLFDDTYRAKTIIITPKIKIPAPAGEGQNGTARFLTQKEKEKVFETYTISLKDKFFKSLMSNGKSYYNATTKGIFQNVLPVKNINKTKLPQSGGLVIGMTKLSKNQEKIYYVSKNYHTLIFGATGSGKTRTLVIQSICLTALSGEGIVINDPKGEIYYYTHRLLASLGYDVIVMDLQNPEKSASKNLLQPIIDEVKAGNNDKAQRATWDLIETIVAKSDKGEPIWTNGEKAIIGACVLAVVCDNKDNPQYQNLTNVYYFLANMVKTDDYTGKTYLEDYIAKMDDNHPAKALLGITDVAPSRTRASFYTSALTTLRLFATNDIASITGKSDFDFTSIAHKKQVIYYILPDQKTAYYPIVTLLINQQYELLVDYAKSHGNRLPKRVNFFLDEFGNFTPITDIQAKMTVARGYGIRFNLFLQDVKQLEDKYDKNIADIIMGNCSVWVYLSAASDDTNKLISSRIGQYTTLKYSSSGNKSKYSNPSSGYSSQLEGRDLLKSDELPRIQRPYQLVLTLGEFPAMMQSDDLHKWFFNKMLGLGDEKHNNNYIALLSQNRPTTCDTNKPLQLWKPWKFYEDGISTTKINNDNIKTNTITEKDFVMQNQNEISEDDYFRRTKK